LDITRRDFLEGVALAVPGAAAARAGLPPESQGGLQGQTDALMASAHRLRGPAAAGADGVAELDPGIEDLVVVGAGLSGLAGACLYRRHAGRPVRVLLLDALDAVGGHARRNEFVSRSGRRLIGYGGSQSLDTPGLFSPAAHELLRSVGIELERFKEGLFDSGWAARQGLVHSARWFDPRVWGESAHPLLLRRREEAAADWLARTPLPGPARQDLQRLLAEGPPARPLHGSRAARRRQLSAISYRDFLRRHWRVHDAVLAWWGDETLGYFGVGIDATSALDAYAAGLPGFKALDLGEQVDPLMSASARQLMAGQDDYIYHFPDGNAALAHALLRELRPDAVPGQGMASLADVKVGQELLDLAEAPVRVRLRATALGLRHLGPPQRAELVELSYVDAAGALRRVRARHLLLACWHRVIARLAPELAAAQRRALDDQVKVPLLYATVLVSNWRPWQRAGIRALRAPGSFWSGAELDFPVSLGGVRFPQQADEPMLLHLSRVVVPGDGRSPRAQSSAGRELLRQWPFERLEHEVRRLLQGALGGHGFDHGRDIEAITVNRWAHGYTLEYARPWDAFWPQGPLPCERARRPWGRVAIAGSDSGAYAYAHGAIDQAHRAVQELLPQARLPRWHATPGPDPRAIGL